MAALVAGGLHDILKNYLPRSHVACIKHRNNILVVVNMKVLTKFIFLLTSVTALESQLSGLRNISQGARCFCVNSSVCGLIMRVK